MPKSNPTKDAANAGVASAWLSIRDAAAIAGASVRAMQKRAARGSIAARKVTRDGVEVWEFDARDLGASTVSKVDASTGANLSEMDAPKLSNHAHSGDKVDASKVVNVDASTGQSGRVHSDALTARLLAQLESENGFLRAQLEAVTQSEAQTKAALREALRAMPKQLTAGAPGVASAPVASDAHKPTSNAPETATATGAIDYNAICDWLEMEMNQ